METAPMVWITINIHRLSMAESPLTFRETVPMAWITANIFRDCPHGLNHL